MEPVLNSSHAGAVTPASHSIHGVSGEMAGGAPLHAVGHAPVLGISSGILAEPPKSATRDLPVFGTSGMSVLGVLGESHGSTAGSGAILESSIVSPTASVLVGTTATVLTTMGGEQVSDLAAVPHSSEGTAAESQLAAVGGGDFDEAVPHHILEQFPEPLTAEQRGAIGRRVWYLSKRLQRCRRNLHVVSRGSSSLERVIALLLSKRELAQSDVDSLAAPAQKSPGPSAVSGPGKRARDDAPATDAEAAQSVAGGSDVTPPSASSPGTAPGDPPPKRRTGIFRASAVFNNLRSVLVAAKREEEDHAAVTQSRNRIAKETQLRIISEDLEKQETLIAPLREKREHFAKQVEETTAELIETLEVYALVNRFETQYSASFFLQCSEEADAADGDGEAAACAPHIVYFAPGKHTSRTEHLIREQVNKGLDAYLEYHERIRPTLERIAAVQEEMRQKRQTELLEVIGFSSADIASYRLMASTGEDRGAATASELLRPGNEDELPDDPGPKDEADDVADESKQRAMIDSALSLLDDFDD